MANALGCIARISDMGIIPCRMEHLASNESRIRLLYSCAACGRHFSQTQYPFLGNAGRPPSAMPSGSVSSTGQDTAWIVWADLSEIYLMSESDRISRRSFESAFLPFFDLLPLGSSFDIVAQLIKNAQKKTDRCLTCLSC